MTGTPEQIARSTRPWQEAGIDGINVINATIPGSYTEFIEHVMPVLRKRGLAKEAYTPGTLRRKLFGRDTLPPTHPAAAYRNAFREMTITPTALARRRRSARRAHRHTDNRACIYRSKCKPRSTIFDLSFAYAVDQRGPRIDGSAGLLSPAAPAAPFSPWGLPFSWANC